MYLVTMELITQHAVQIPACALMEDFVLKVLPFMIPDMKFDMPLDEGLARI